MISVHGMHGMVMTLTKVGGSVMNNISFCDTCMMKWVNYNKGIESV